MSLRAASFDACEPCNRMTAHDRKGACMVCRKRHRKARRKLKAATLGSNLVRYGALMSIADDLRSAYVRAVASGCAVCGKLLFPNELQWAHVFARKIRPRLRYHEDNAVAACAGCHFKHTPAGPEWYWWAESYFGTERYRLLVLANDLAPRITSDVLQLTIIADQARIAALPAGDRKDWALWRQARILEDYVRLGVRAA